MEYHARLQQRSSFGADPTGASAGTAAGNSQAAAPGPSNGSALSLNLIDAFGTASANSPFRVMSPLASPSASSVFSLQQSPSHQPHPLSTSSAHPHHTLSSLSRSSSTNFSQQQHSQQQQQQHPHQGRMPPRPAVVRSKTGGPMHPLNAFATDSPLDAAPASPLSPSSSANFDAPEGFGPPRRSVTAGPSLWGSPRLGSGALGASSGSSSPAPEIWNATSSIDSPLIKDLRSRTRGNSNSSDSGIWQNNGSTQGSLPFSSMPSARVRGPPARAATLATQHDIDAHELGERRSTLGTDPILPESLQAAVAVTLEPEELGDLRSSPTSALEPQEIEDEPPVMAHRAIRAATRGFPLRGVRAPQRATTLDPGHHLPKPQTDSPRRFGGRLSPVQDSSLGSSRTSTLGSTAPDAGQLSYVTDRGSDSSGSEGRGHRMAEARAGNPQASTASNQWFGLNAQASPLAVGGSLGPALQPSQHEMLLQAELDRQYEAFKQQIHSQGPMGNNLDGFGTQGNLGQENLAAAMRSAQFGGGLNEHTGAYGNQGAPSDGYRQHALNAFDHQGADLSQAQGHNAAFNTFASPLLQSQRPGLPPANPEAALAAALRQQQNESAQHQPYTQGPDWTRGPAARGLPPHQQNSSALGLSQRQPATHGPQDHQLYQAMANMDLGRPLPTGPASSGPQLPQQRPPYLGASQGMMASASVPPHLHPRQQHQPGHGRGGPAHMVPSHSNSPMQSLPSSGTRSLLLEEFRSKRIIPLGAGPHHGAHSSRANQANAAAHDATTTWTLDDIRGHVVEFCMDQHGSRFAQEKLDHASRAQIDWVFEEIRPSARSLMQDVFGNYVVQKMFEYGSDSQRLSLTEEIRGHVVPLSLGTYGCRVIQKALDYLPDSTRLALADELHGHVLELVQDQNANHVVQKLLSVVRDPDAVKFISDAFRGRVLDLGAHCYSCRVLQRIFERCGEGQARPLLQELHTGSEKLMADQYGNYVIQWILQKGLPQDKERVIESVVGNVLTLSRHKFASNVVEQVVRAASKPQRRRLAAEILQPAAGPATSPAQAPTQPGDQASAAANLMMTDQYANYVLQRFLELCENDQKARLVSLLQPRLIALRRGAGGPGGWTKHLAAVERLVNEATGAMPPGDERDRAFIDAPTGPAAASSTPLSTPALGPGAGSFSSPRSSAHSSPRRGMNVNPNHSAPRYPHSHPHSHSQLQHQHPHQHQQHQQQHPQHPQHPQQQQQHHHHHHRAHKAPPTLYTVN